MPPKASQQSTANAVAAALRRRSERQQTADSSAKHADPPKKTPRRSSKTDPTVKPLLFWSPEEVATIVQAWRDCIANPPARPRKTAGGFNARLFARFLELSGGSSPRVLQSVIAKKQLLNNSYQFILDFNKNRSTTLAAKAAGASRKKPAPASSRKSPAKGKKSARGRRAKKGDDSEGDDDDDSDDDGDDTAEDGDDSVNHWFKLTKTKQKAAAMKMFMTEQRQYALLGMDQRTFDSMGEISKLEGKLNVRQTWSDEEVQLMFRAWRETITKPQKDKRGPLFTMNSRIFQLMGSMSNGTLRRTKQSVILKKDSMKVSCEFILEYNDKILESGAEGSAKKKLSTWFSLTQREQERIVSRQFPKSGFMYFSEAQFIEINALIRDTERMAAEFGVRQGVAWLHDENVVLVRAWRDIVDRPRRQLRPNVILGLCVYERFLSIAKGAYSRTERATLLKLESIKNMHEYIADYNQRVGKKNPSKDWFLMDKSDRKRVHLEDVRAIGVSEDRTKSFTDLDKPMFDAVTKINSKKRPLNSITFVLSKEDEEERDAGEDSENDEEGAADEGDGGENDNEEEGSYRSEDSESEYDHPAYLKWGNKKPKQPTAPEGEDTASDDDEDGDTGEEDHGNTTGNGKSNNHENVPNSFIQVTRDHQTAPVAKDFVQISDHEDTHEDELMQGAADKLTGGDEVEEKQPVPSFRNRRTNVAKITSSADSRTEKKRQKATTLSTFTLHELADLATRVDNEAESADSDDESDAQDHGFKADALPQQDQEEDYDEKTQTQLNPSNDVATLVQIMQKQSEQMFHVMRDIRDEIKRDREDRELFREEMRVDREERRQHEDGESRKRSRSDDEESSPSKKKSTRRLSVQRDGFVVRL